MMNHQDGYENNVKDTRKVALTFGVLDIIYTDRQTDRQTDVVLDVIRKTQRSGSSRTG